MCTMILGEPILDPAVFEHNSVKYSPFSTNNTSTPWSGIGVKLEYVMCEHWFIECLHGNIEQNFNHMIRNTLRHIVKLVAIKQSLLMDVISKPESRFNHECRNSASAALFKGRKVKRAWQALSSRSADCPFTHGVSLPRATGNKQLSDTSTLVSFCY